MKELKLSFCLLQICRLQDIIEEVDRKTGEAKVVWFTAVLLFFFYRSFSPCTYVFSASLSSVF